MLYKGYYIVVKSTKTKKVEIRPEATKNTVVKLVSTEDEAINWIDKIVR